MRSASAFWFVLAVLAACAPPPSPAPQQGPLEWHGEMIERGGYAITGAGYVQNRYGRIVAMAMLFNATPGQELPWHVHRGTCGVPGGPIVGPDSSYQPVTVAADGSGVRSAEVHGMRLDPTQRYKLDVHRSPDEMDVIVACANLTARPLGSRNP
ncbi:MAG TPA: hypothetical protein VEQ60_01240 [Longimicrobium sp.]|nr:hypothetical protein [Longimicrobium sp.]